MKPLTPVSIEMQLKQKRPFILALPLSTAPIHKQSGGAVKWHTDNGNWEQVGSGEKLLR
jgi:hypothetical protein